MLINRAHRTIGDWQIGSRAGVYITGHTVYHGFFVPWGDDALVRITGQKVMRAQPGYLVPKLLEPTLASWRAMLTRTKQPGCDGYDRYRTVPVFPEWTPDHYFLGGLRGHLYEHMCGFYRFVRDVGVRPAGTTLDRLPPTYRYWPGEVRWATVRQQTENRRAA